jgi:hypothetical protein
VEVPGKISIAVTRAISAAVRPSVLVDVGDVGEGTLRQPTRIVSKRPKVIWGEGDNFIYGPLSFSYSSYRRMVSVATRSAADSFTYAEARFHFLKDCRLIPKIVSGYVDEQRSAPGPHADEVGLFDQLDNPSG